MSEAGNALLGIGMGTGDDRAIDAAEQAVASPLLETSMEGARKILLSITGGADLSLWEVNEAAKAVSEAAHPEANIIFGAMVDEKLGDQVWVTVVATGYGPVIDAPGLPGARGARRRAARRAASEPERSSVRQTGLGVNQLDVPEFVPRGIAHDRRRRRRRPSRHRGGRRAGAARRRQRRRRGDRRDAHVVDRRAAADRPGRRRLHARRGARCRADAARLLRRGARARPAGRTSARAALIPVSRVVRRRRADLPRRSRVVRAVRQPGGDRGGGARAGARCRWTSWRRPPRGSRARASCSTSRRPTSSRSSRASCSRRPRRAPCSRPAAGRCAPASGSASARWATRSTGWAPRAPTRSTGATWPTRSSTGSTQRGGVLTPDRPRRLRARSADARPRCRYRGREVLTNPPPSAGGVLLAYSLGLLDRAPSPPPLRAVVDAMDAAQTARTDAFVAGSTSRGSSTPSSPCGSARRRTSRWSTRRARRAR